MEFCQLREVGTLSPVSHITFLSTNLKFSTRSFLVALPQRTEQLIWSLRVCTVGWLLAWMLVSFLQFKTVQISNSLTVQIKLDRNSRSASIDKVAST